MMRTTGKPCSLYFHIPFCRRKCPYCHFFTLPKKESLENTFYPSLLKELELRLPSIEKRPLASLYFGGGTPALAPPTILSQIITRCEPFLDKDVEITLEANPEDLSLDLLEEFAHIGINRLSIGGQSFSSQHLKNLGRGHGPQAIIQSVEWAKQAGIHNLSLDLMYELPQQTLSSWEESLIQAASLPITHISLYNLTIEPNTIFYKKRNELLPKLPSHDLGKEMFLLTRKILEQHGFEQYELSAFCRDSKVSKHNLGYWTGREFLGLGPSAFSYWKGRREQNICKLSSYHKLLNEGTLPIDFTEELTGEAKIAEQIAIGLRPAKGLKLEPFLPLPEKTKQSINKLIQAGLVEKKDKKLFLTEKGRLYYDSVGEELVVLT